MTNTGGRSAIVFGSYGGESPADELETRAAAGKRPRSAYVELARALNADVIDSHYMRQYANRVARWVANRFNQPTGQILQVFLSRRRYVHICAWSDRIALPLALLFKLTRSRRDLALWAVWLSRQKKAIFLRYFRAHTHLGSIVCSSTLQLKIADEHLGVPKEKLFFVRQPVDEKFWQSQPARAENLICAVGWEARDYGTLVKASSGLEVEVHIAVGIAAVPTLAAAGESPNLPSSFGGGRRRETAALRGLKRTFSYKLYEEWMEEVAREGVPPNLRIFQQLAPLELRSLYGKALFVVVPLHDVDTDCGVTAVTEAMAMGKAVIVSRTRGLDVIQDHEQGICVPPADPPALRRAIDYLLANPREAERMGQAGRALVEAEHGLDDFVSRFTEIIRGR